MISIFQKPIICTKYATETISKLATVLCWRDRLQPKTNLNVLVDIKILTSRKVLLRKITKYINAIWKKIPPATELIIPVLLGIHLNDRLHKHRHSYKYESRDKFYKIIKAFLGNENKSHRKPNHVNIIRMDQKGPTSA